MYFVIYSAKLPENVVAMLKQNFDGDRGELEVQLLPNLDFDVHQSIKRITELSLPGMPT